MGLPPTTGERSAATLQPATPVGGFSAGHVIEAREYRRTDDYGTAEPEISTPAPLPASGERGVNFIVSTTSAQAMIESDAQHLRVLIANEKRDRLELLAQVVIGLGHDVIAREISVKDVGAVTAREHPDVALVGLGSSSGHALELISEIVREASCPVIACSTPTTPPTSMRPRSAACSRTSSTATPEELQSAIDITFQRFTRVSEPAGSIRAARRDRTGKGDPHGPPLDQCHQCLREATRPLAAHRTQAQRRRLVRRREPPPAHSPRAPATGIVRTIGCDHAAHRRQPGLH